MGLAHEELRRWIGLREASRTPIISNRWIDGGSFGIPGRDYVQYHHVHINCLPTRIRTTRGTRRTQQDMKCRAGCQMSETAAHVIQGCFRTHGGRIKRHNAVCRFLAAGLRDAGWRVSEEPRYRTNIGLRKPDLLATRNGVVNIIDTQVVNGATALDESHERKVTYYSGNEHLRQMIGQQHDVQPSVIKFSSCTLSWRGVWSQASAHNLMGLGLSTRFLSDITTRVLQGSHTNWERWNKMTGLRRSLNLPQVGRL